MGIARHGDELCHSQGIDDEVVADPSRAGRRRRCVCRRDLRRQRMALGDALPGRCRRLRAGVRPRVGFHFVSVHV